MKRYWRPYFTGSEDFSKVFHFDWNRQHVTAVDVFSQRWSQDLFSHGLYSVQCAFTWPCCCELVTWDTTGRQPGLAHVEPRPRAALWAFFLACSGQGFSILRTDRARPEVEGLKTWPVFAKRGTAKRRVQSRTPPEIRCCSPVWAVWACHRLRSAYMRQSWDRTWSKGHHRTWVQKFSLI